MHVHACTFACICVFAYLFVRCSYPQIWKRGEEDIWLGVDRSKDEHYKPRPPEFKANAVKPTLMVLSGDPETMALYMNKATQDLYSGDALRRKEWLTLRDSINKTFPPRDSVNWGFLAEDEHEPKITDPWGCFPNKPKTQEAIPKDQILHEFIGRDGAYSYVFTREKFENTDDTEDQDSTTFEPPEKVFLVAEQDNVTIGVQECVFSHTSGDWVMGAKASKLTDTETSTYVACEWTSQKDLVMVEDSSGDSAPQSWYKALLPKLQVGSSSEVTISNHHAANQSDGKEVSMSEFICDTTGKCPVTTLPLFLSVSLSLSLSLPLSLPSLSPLPSSISLASSGCL